MRKISKLAVVLAIAAGSLGTVAAAGSLGTVAAAPALASPGGGNCIPGMPCP
jgi:hypothetical protein